MNLYAYCGNNPVMRIDENGNAWWHWLLGIVAVVALAAVVVTSAVITGGASLVAMGIGFAVGATANFVSQGIGNILSGKNFFDNMSVGSILIGGLIGAAYATGLGGIAGALGIGIAAGVLTASIEEKSFKDILFSGLVVGVSSIVSYGIGQIIGRVVFQNDGLVFNDFMNLAKADGAKMIQALFTALKSSWYTFLPSVVQGVMRAILNFVGKKEL